MLKYKNTKTIDVSDWDALVEKTYGKPYSFQQQNGCQNRGQVPITIPETWDDDAGMNDSIPEEINGEEMGVKFEVWKARNPKEWNGKSDSKNFTSMFWERNFYPDLQTVANDLHSKGLIETGDYVIDIDW